MTSTLATSNQLTFDEAVRIARNWGFGGNVPDSLHSLALAVLAPTKPVIEYVTVDSEEDDWQCETAMQEAMEWKQQFIENWEYKHG